MHLTRTVYTSFFFFRFETLSAQNQFCVKKSNTNEKTIQTSDDGKKKKTTKKSFPPPFLMFFPGGRGGEQQQQQQQQQRETTRRRRTTTTTTKKPPATMKTTTKTTTLLRGWKLPTSPFSEHHQRTRERQSSSTLPLLNNKEQIGESQRRRRRRLDDAKVKTSTDIYDGSTTSEKKKNRNSAPFFLAAASVASREGGREALQKSWRSMRALGEGWGGGGEAGSKSSERSSSKSKSSNRGKSGSRASSSSSSTKTTTSRKKKSKAITTKSTTTTTTTSSSSTKELTQREEINRRLLAGTMSTICVRTLLAPLERLKTEYLFNNSKEALFVTSKIVFKNEGVIGFWKGNLVNIVRTAPFKAINFSAFDTVRTAITKTFDVKENTVADEVSLFLSGAFACGTAVTICYPMDVVRTRLVVRGGTQKYKNILSCVRMLYKEEGLASFYRGILPAMAQMTPNAAVYYSVYNSLKQYRLTQMKREGEEKANRRKKKNNNNNNNRGSGKKDNTTGELNNKKTIEPQYMMLFGMVAGIASESFTFPLEVARRRIQMNTGRVVAKDIFGSKELKMMLEVTQKVLRENGFRGLYAGLAPSVLQVLPSAALGYYCYESFKLAVGVD